MNNDSSAQASWGPTYVAAEDYRLSRDQVAQGFGLPNDAGSDQFGVASHRKTFRTFIRNLITYMQKDPNFRGVQFTEDFPAELQQCPRVVWGLVNRRAGIDDKMHKGPQLMETWPLEDGTVLEKWIQPQTFEFSFSIFHVSSTAADVLMEEIEHWVVKNPLLVGASGADNLMFTSEGPHEILQVSNSQVVRKRTLYYTGDMRYIYHNLVDSIKTIKIWSNNTSDLEFQTFEMVRANNEPPTAFDLLNLPASSILFAIHTSPTTVANDYLPNIDYSVVLQKEKYITKAFIHWLALGKRPSVGESYYISCALPASRQATQGVVVTDGYDNTQPITSKQRRGKYPRLPQVPRVLGAPVDPENLQAGRTIIFLTEDNQGTLQTATLNKTYVDALIQSTINTVAVLDTTDYIASQDS